MFAQPKTSFLKKIIACVCALAFATSLMPVTALAAPLSQPRAATEDFALVAQDDSNRPIHREQRDIRNYYKDHGINMNKATSLDVTPQLTAPYSWGAVSQSSQSETLATLNFIRYVAGIEDSVMLDANYGTLAQAAAVTDASIGQLTHYPSRPEGMSDEMFALSENGAKASNLYASSISSNLHQAVLSWMDDSDEQNIAKLGHRRWILNPLMGKTGFGFVADSGGKGGFRSWASMYALDDSNAHAVRQNVAWPAENMPVELFDSSQAWSLSTGTKIDDFSKVKVTVTRDADKRTWNFSEESSDGDFYIDNEGYGQTGCVIFRPKDISVGISDLYTVSVTGISNPITYDVNFFGLIDNELTQMSLDETSYEYTGSEIKPKPTVKYYDKVLTCDVDYELSYRDNVNEGTATVTAKGIGDYTGVLSTQFQIVPGSAVKPDEGGSATPTPSDPKGSPVIMYRLYNPNSGEHFYTASEYERAYLINVGWNNEDIGWIAPSEGQPVYRLYNSIGGEHHYTLSIVERDNLISIGWNDEGIGWYSGGHTPLYRQYNPNAYANNHNYTTSEVERDNVLAAGWNDEGIGWYGIE